MTSARADAGARWDGGEIAAEGLRRGHEVVCLARGESGPVPEGARLVRADRDRSDAYDAVAGERWDAVLDVASLPEHVQGAVAALDSARYALVSTGNVYAEHAAMHADEHAALLDPQGDPADPGEAYGMGKVACERAVLAVHGEQALVARAGLIGGPGDTSGRSGYWPWRFANPSSSAVLVPDAGARSSQVIDVRDLTAWLVRSMKEGISGVFDAVGPVLPLAEHLAAARDVSAAAVEAVLAPEAWLADHEVNEWAGPRSLPLWLADPAWQGFAARDGSHARAAGLVHRPLERTLRDVLAWEQAQPVHPHGAGLADDDERSLLAALRSGVPSVDR